MLSVRLPLPLFRPAFARSLVKLVNRRNPDAPKPPRSAFAFFLNQQYPAITKEMGEGHSAPDVMKQAGRMWRGLNEGEREPYLTLAQSDKERYQTERASFSGPLMKQVKKKQKRDPNAPKRPPTAFILFSRSLEKVEGESVTDRAKRAGEEWRRLSEADKKPFEEDYQNKIKEYAVLAEMYQATLPKEESGEEAGKAAKGAKKAATKKAAKGDAKGAKKSTTGAKKGAKRSAKAAKEGKSSADSTPAAADAAASE